MLADVALGEGAVDRVGERMQPDVGVGMAAERRGMGDANAAQPHVVAGRKGVNIEALADPGLAEVRREPRLRRVEILHCGHLDVGGIAFEHVSRRARPFGDRDVVSEIADAGRGGAPVGREDEREAKSLRRLHGSQRRARGRREHSTIDVDLFDSVAHRRSGRRRSMALGSLDGARHESCRREGSRCVVDEHDVRRRCGERLEPGQNALLPGRATDCRRPERLGRARCQLRHGLVVERPVIGADDDRYGREREARRKRLKGVDDKRASSAGDILLRPVPAEPLAPTARDDHKPDLIH